MRRLITREEGDELSFVKTEKSGETVWEGLNVSAELLFGC